MPCVPLLWSISLFPRQAIDYEPSPPTRGMQMDVFELKADVSLVWHMSAGRCEVRLLTYKRAGQAGERPRGAGGPAE